MQRKCVTGKNIYLSEQIAEDVLIELWSKNEYSATRSPIAVYRCEDCGYYHLTSQGKMNDKLASEISSGKMKLMKEANRWMDKWKKR